MTDYFCHLQENFVININKKLMDAATKTGTDASKTASKRVVEKLQKLEET